MIQNSLNSEEKLWSTSAAFGPELSVLCKRHLGFLAMSNCKLYSCTCKSPWHSVSSFLLQKPLQSLSSTKKLAKVSDHIRCIVLLLLLQLFNPFGMSPSGRKTLIPVWFGGHLNFASSPTVGPTNPGTSHCLTLGFVTVPQVQTWGRGRYFLRVIRGTWVRSLKLGSVINPLSLYIVRESCTFQLQIIAGLDAHFKHANSSTSASWHL